jgi:hypothetical protein
MSSEVAIAKLKTLTPEHQQEVLDFIEFLELKERREAPTPDIEVDSDASDWKLEPFFGIWRDREDMKDSSAWVRQLRRRSWNRENGPIDPS